MIDALEDLVTVLGRLEGLQGRVYRRWPKKKAVMPCCLISRISATPTFTDADGGEVIATLTYSIDINAVTPDEADAIASRVIDALAQYNFHRTGDMDFYDDQLRASRRILTFMGTVDKRGNTFTQ